jgi:hypothetical protein
MAALPVFMSQRAAIRAKVTAAKLGHDNDKGAVPALSAGDTLTLRCGLSRAPSSDLGWRAFRDREIGFGRQDCLHSPLPGALHCSAGASRQEARIADGGHSVIVVRCLQMQASRLGKRNMITVQRCGRRSTRWVRRTRGAWFLSGH